MKVGDLVRHTHNRWGFGIVIEVIDDHWETRLPSADVLWWDGETNCHAQHWLEVVSEAQV